MKIGLCSLDLKKDSMINMTSVNKILLKRYRSEFSKQFEDYFVSVLFIHPLCY